MRSSTQPRREPVVRELSLSKPSIVPAARFLKHRAKKPLAEPGAAGARQFLREHWCEPSAPGSAGGFFERKSSSWNLAFRVSMNSGTVMPVCEYP